MPDVIATRSAYRGRVFHVAVDRVVLPDGKPRDIDVVRHPGSVVIVAMPDAATIVMVRQYRHAVARWLWELPAGTLEPGEDPLAAARRECEEETGYAAACIEHLGSFFPVPGYGDEEMHLYRLTDLSRPAHPAAPDEDEDIEARTFTVEQARAMVREGGIVDLKTALALMMI